MEKLFDESELRKMSNADLVRLYKRIESDMTLQILDMGALLVQMESSPYVGSFDSFMEKELGIDPEKGHLLMEGWKMFKGAKG